MSSVTSELTGLAAALQFVMSGGQMKRKLSLPGASCKAESGGSAKQMKASKSKGQRTLDEFEKHAAKLCEHVVLFDTWMSLV